MPPPRAWCARGSGRDEGKLEDGGGWGGLLQHASAPPDQKGSLFLRFQRASAPPGLKGTLFLRF